MAGRAATLARFRCSQQHWMTLPGCMCDSLRVCIGELRPVAGRIRRDPNASCLPYNNSCTSQGVRPDPCRAGHFPSPASHEHLRCNQSFFTSCCPTNTMQTQIIILASKVAKKYVADYVKFYKCSETFLVARSAIGDWRRPSRCCRRTLQWRPCLSAGQSVPYAPYIQWHL